MPAPVSLTSMTTVPFDRSALSVTRPCSGVNLMALLSRFQTTCCMRAGSHMIACAPSMSHSSLIRLASAAGRTESTAASRIERTLTARNSSRSFPVMIREMSSRSSMSWACSRVLRSMISIARRAGRLVQVTARQQARPAEDRVERRAQLVRQRGQELVLRAVGGLGLQPRLLLALEELTTFFLGAVQRQRVAQAPFEPFCRQRVLVQIVRRAGLHQLDGHLFVTLSGQRDHWDGIAAVAQLAQHRQSVGPRKVIVEQHAVERRLFDGLARGALIVALGRPRCETPIACSSRFTAMRSTRSSSTIRTRSVSAIGRS